MADVIITPASGLIDFQNASGISSATIQLDGNGNLALSAAGGDIQIGDTSADIFIGDGINNVDLIFEENGEIRGLTGKTITLGQSDSFISFAGDITGNVDFTGTLTAGQNGKIVFPDNTTVPDSPTNQQHDYITFGANGSISQVSGRGALLFTSSDDSMVIANGDVGRAFTNSNINVGDESIFLLSDNALYVKTDLQEGWGTENNLIFSNTGVLSVNGNTVWHAGNDGAGSGLDADLLDGISSASFLRSDAADTFTGVLTSNVASTGAIVLNKTVATNYAGISWQEVGDLRWLMYVSNNADGTFNLQARKNGTNVKQVFSVNQSTGIFDFSQSSATIASNTIWHAGNDGSGSGLDADLLDGAQPNVSASNSTIVKRHSSGYIYANYFNTTPNDVSSGVTRICCETGNDGFIRHATADAVRGFIDDGRYLRSNASDTYEGTTSGRVLRFQCVSGRTANSSSGSLFPLEVFQATANTDAAITFHIGSDYAAYFGLDGTTNDLFYGGWSVGAAKYKIWHAANDGSGSGLDADLLDGLQLHTGTNNEANKVVRTDGNGYIQAGWINSTSGDRGSTIPSRIYGSNDAYIRYYDLASFRSFMNVTAKANYQGREQNTADTNYWTGSMGYGNVDLNTVFHYGSGDWDSWGTPANRPSTATTHWNGSQVLHYTNGTNAYGYQIACGSSAGAGELYIRTRWGTAFSGWSKIWNAANDGAGSGLDADTLDGTQLSAIKTNSSTDTNNVFIRNGSPTIYLRDTNHRSSMIHCNSNLFYVLRGSGNDSTSWATTGGAWPLVINLENNDITGGRNINAVGDVTAFSSDRRLKENFKHIDSPLEKIKKLNGYNFDWKEEVKELGFSPDISKNDIGLIAQEVQEVVPQAVAPAPFDQEWNNDIKKNISKSGEDYLTVKYDKLVPLLVEAIKELKAEVETLKAERN